MNRKFTPGQTVLVAASYTLRRGLLEGLLVKVVKYPLSPLQKLVVQTNQGFEVCELVTIQYRTYICSVPECDLRGSHERIQ